MDDSEETGVCPFCVIALVHFWTTISIPWILSNALKIVSKFKGLLSPAGDNTVLGANGTTTAFARRHVVVLAMSTLQTIII